MYMKTSIRELEIYGAERAVELDVRGSSLFVTVGGMCIEVDKHDFSYGVSELLKQR